MNKIFKALLISDIFPPQHGGSGRWFWEVYSRLSRDEYILAVGKSENYEAFDTTHDLAIERCDFKSTSWGVTDKAGLTYYWHCFWLIRKLIKKHQITHLHCGRCLPEGFIAYLINLLYGLPYLCYIHGEDVETASESRELSWIIKQVFKRANKLICNSQNTANIILNKWKVPQNKAMVLHPGVDTERFKPAERNLIIRKQLGWEDRPVILTVGRLQERKGQDMTIKSMPEIIKRLPNTLYAIIGNGERKEYLLSLVEELNLQDHVLFHDEISDEQMIQCYQQCDCFILPNRQVGNDIEGFGMVLVEAQACGKLVIAGDSGGTKETLIEGTTGFVVDCTSEKTLSNKLLEILTTTDSKISQLKCRQHVEDNFNWSKLALKAEHIFRSPGL